LFKIPDVILDSIISAQNLVAITVRFFHQEHDHFTFEYTASYKWLLAHGWRTLSI